MKTRHICLFKNGRWNVIKSLGTFEGFQAARSARDEYKARNSSIDPLDIECFLVSICEKHSFGEI